MRLPTGEIPNICLARLAKQKATKLILQVTKRGSAQAEKSNLKRLNGLEICAEADWEEATHIGEIVGLFFCLIFSYSRQNFIGGVLSSSRPLFGFIFYHTSQFASLRQRIHSAHLSVSLAWTVAAAAAAGGGC